MDNGPELISIALAECDEEHKIHLDFIQLGKLTQVEYRMKYCPENYN